MGPSKFLRKHSYTYSSYANMKRRCYSPNDHSFPQYGGRGIKVCERWLAPNGCGFRAFLADMGERPQGTLIDRIDNNGGYEPHNCRWATPKEQQRNKRNNKLLTFGGKTQPIASWAEEVGLKQMTIVVRKRRGWSDEDALKSIGHTTDRRRVLTAHDANAIRRRRQSGERGKSLAAEFGCSPQLIYDIAAGRKWK